MASPKKKTPEKAAKPVKATAAVPKKPRAKGKKTRAVGQRGGIGRNRSKEAELLVKRDKILDLATGGASIRQIAEHLAELGFEGVSRSRVHQLLVEALDDLHETQRMKTRHYLQLELGKLNRVELAHFNKLLKADDADHIEKLSRAMSRVWDRRDSLLGLRKPIEVKVDPRETLAKLIGVRPEDLPSGDADS